MFAVIDMFSQDLHVRIFRRHRSAEPLTLAMEISVLCRTVEARVIREVNPGGNRPADLGVIERMGSSFSRPGEPGKNALASNDLRCPSSDSGVARRTLRGVRRSRGRHIALEVRCQPTESAICGMECDTSHRTSPPVCSVV
jgi:hypothetical protein